MAAAAAIATPHSSHAFDFRIDDEWYSAKICTPVPSPVANIFLVELLRWSTYILYRSVGVLTPDDFHGHGIGHATDIALSMQDATRLQKIEHVSDPVLGDFLRVTLRLPGVAGAFHDEAFECRQAPAQENDALHKLERKVMDLERRTTCPVGTILMYSGPVADIPRGWALCNGENGNPDLRGRFIRGGPMDQQPVGSIGGSDTLPLPQVQIDAHSVSFPVSAATIPMKTGIRGWSGEVPVVNSVSGGGSSSLSHTVHVTRASSSIVPPFFVLMYIIRLYRTLHQQQHERQRDFSKIVLEKRGGTCIVVSFGMSQPAPKIAGTWTQRPSPTSVKGPFGILVNLPMSEPIRVWTITQSYDSVTATLAGGSTMRHVTHGTWDGSKFNFTMERGGTGPSDCNHLFGHIIVKGPTVVVFVVTGSCGTGGLPVGYTETFTFDKTA